VVVELTPEDSMWVRLEGLKRNLDFYPRSRIRGTIALAQELRRRGDEELGRAYLENEARDPRVALELARWDLASNRVEDAEARLAELVRRQGLTASIRAQSWAVTAMVRDHRGDPEGALVAANQALRFDPRSPAPYRVLAGLAERRGDLNEALDHLRRAWGMNPTDIGLLLAVASVAERAGHPDDARLALERAVAVDPDSPVIRARLADFQLRQGDYMEATLTLSAALDRFPTDARLLALAERLRKEVSRR
jgi:Flp pilus assembly protein TadD